MKVFLLSAVILLTGCSEIHNFELDILYERCQEHEGLRHVHLNANFKPLARCNDGEYVNAI